ncbi:BnaC04g32300D [Brassica napus]|uniref:BnaC04g32300D protein n=1 Tax=Brassica napus TaxID=3708 RepID=A0A078HG93_BRANA|nr:BnaC04g32300D [Brassica napus]
MFLPSPFSCLVSLSPASLSTFLFLFHFLVRTKLRSLWLLRTNFQSSNATSKSFLPQDKRQNLGPAKTLDSLMGLYLITRLARQKCFSIRRLELFDLDLRNNNFIGRLPDIFDKGCSLKSLDVSHNQITGKLPRSLINCTHLEYLNVEGNRIADTYPFWLKELPKLQVIVLRSNMFHGPIYSPHHPLSFSQLRIVDISCNKFTGRLPQDYFVNWSKLLLGIHQEERESMYMGNNYHYGYNLYVYYPSMYLRNKGINMELKKIFTYKSKEQVLELESSGCFGDKIPSTPEAEEPRPQKQEQVLNWKAAAMGYGPGILFGLAIGQILYSYKPVLFYKLFRI